MTSELDQKLGFMLQRMKSAGKDELDTHFSEWWGDLEPDVKNDYTNTLRARASLIFPKRDNAKVLECLPWNLTPRKGELGIMLDTWYPKNMSGKSFLRECLRWKVSVTTSPVQDQILRGSRTTQIIQFAKMMLKRHPDQYTTTDLDPEKELKNMIQEGHFVQLEFGFVSPNLFQVKISDNDAILMSGWPLRLLELDDKMNTEEGIYVTQISNKYPIIELEDYITGLDPIKLMSNNDASQYIRSLIQMALSNSRGSEIPDLYNLIYPNFLDSQLPNIIGKPQAIASATWEFEGTKFYVQKSSMEGEGWNPPRLWVNPHLPNQPRNLENEGWHSVSLRLGSLKQLQIAFAKHSGKKLSRNECRSKGVMTRELVRFSIISQSVTVSDEYTNDFLEKNWLRSE